MSQVLTLGRSTRSSPLPGTGALMLYVIPRHLWSQPQRWSCEPRAPTARSMNANKSLNRSPMRSPTAQHRKLAISQLRPSPTARSSPWSLLLVSQAADSLSQVPGRLRPQVPLPRRGRQDSRDLKPQEHSRFYQAPGWTVPQRSRHADRATIHIGPSRRYQWPGWRRGLVPRTEGAVHLNPVDGHVLQQDQADDFERD